MMPHSPTGDFLLGGFPCLWRTRPADAWVLAREWRGACSAALVRDPRGRPRLPPGAGDIGWSHAGDRLLLAYAPHGRLGVDVERLARRCDPLRIARRYFDPGETTALEGLAGDALQQAFLRLWCAKEALLKAHGGGIAFGLDRVVLDPAGASPRLLHCDPALGRAQDWLLAEATPEPGYLAVLAWHPGILPR